MTRPALGTALMLMLALLAAAAPRVAAQEETPGGSFITPFPEGDIYKLQAVGDGLAEGMLSGLIDAFGSDGRMLINRRHRAMAGLARFDSEESLRLLDDNLSKDPHHVTVVMIGRDDRVPIRLADSRRLAVASDEWREEYGRRVDRLVKVLKKRGGAVYWVGLPVMRRAEINDDVQAMNDLVRERVYLNGIKFVDAFAGFADEGGNFVAMGPDIGGLVRRLRESDGVGFTPAGNRKLAHFVEREIRRDLAQAKNERAVPLAGSEAEQRKINPAKAVPELVAATVAPGRTIESKSSWASTTNVAPQPTPQAAGPGAEQKADNSRIAVRLAGAGGREETVIIDIVRPAIPASVIQLMTRNATPGKAAQMGDTLQDSIAGGLIVLSSVSPTAEGASGRRPKLAPTQTPYFKVMVKGDRLPPRPGRADDFRWPRLDAVVEAVATPPKSQPVAGAPQHPKAAGQVPLTTQRILQQRRPPPAPRPVE